MALAFINHQRGRNINGFAPPAATTMHIARHSQQAGLYETAPNAHRSDVDNTAVFDEMSDDSSGITQSLTFLQSSGPNNLIL